MKSIYLPILTVVMDITVSNGIFDKTICWLIVTGKMNNFFPVYLQYKKCILSVTFLLKRKKNEFYKNNPSSAVSVRTNECKC